MSEMRTLTYEEEVTLNAICAIAMPIDGWRAVDKATLADLIVAILADAEPGEEPGPTPARAEVERIAGEMLGLVDKTTAFDDPAKFRDIGDVMARNADEDALAQIIIKTIP